MQSVLADGRTANGRIQTSRCVCRHAIHSLCSPHEPPGLPPSPPSECGEDRWRSRIYCRIIKEVAPQYFESAHRKRKFRLENALDKSQRRGDGQSGHMRHA